MATPFSEVYDFFLMKISDYTYLKLSDTELESELFDYMRVAISNFHVCKADLKDRDATQFNQNLSDLELNILSTLMLLEYLKPKILSSKTLKQSLSSNDFKVYSQANHLKEIQSLYKVIKKESQELMTTYSYIKAKEEGDPNV